MPITRCIVIELTRYLTNNLNIELDIEYDA